MIPCYPRSIHISRRGRAARARPYARLNVEAWPAGSPRRGWPWFIPTRARGRPKRRIDPRQPREALSRRNGEGGATGGRGGRPEAFLDSFQIAAELADPTTSRPANDRRRAGSRDEAVSRAVGGRRLLGAVRQPYCTNAAGITSRSLATRSPRTRFGMPEPPSPGGSRRPAR